MPCRWHLLSECLSVCLSVEQCVLRYVELSAFIVVGRQSSRDALIHTLYLVHRLAGWLAGHTGAWTECGQCVSVYRKTYDTDIAYRPSSPTDGT